MQQRVRALQVTEHTARGKQLARPLHVLIVYPLSVYNYMGA
jgi:hypothetical protein